MAERRWSVSVKDSNGDTSPYTSVQSFNLVGVVPTLLTPADNSESDGASFTWAHAGQGGTQEEFAFARSESGVNEQWWDGSEWVDAEVFILSGDESLTMPAGAWSEVPETSWTVRTKEASSGVLSPYSAPFSFTHVVKVQNLDWSYVDGDVVLTWDPRTDVQITGYGVRRDGVDLGYIEEGPNSTTFTDVGVSEGTYEYEVIGFAVFQYLVVGEGGSGGTRIFINVTTKGDVSDQWPSLPDGEVRDIAGWEQDRWLAFGFSIGSDSRRLWVLDRDTGTWDDAWPFLANVPIRSLTFSPDGSYLFVGATTSGLIVIDVASKSIDGSWPTVDDAGGLLIEGDQCFISNSGLSEAAVRVLDISTKTMETGWPTDAALSRPFSWVDEAKTRLLVPLWSSDTFDVLDTGTKTWETGWTKSGNQSWGGLAVPSHGKIFLGEQGIPRYEVIDVATKTAESGWPSTSDDTYGFALIDDDRIVVGISANDFQVWNLGDKSVDGGWPSKDSVFRPHVFRGAL